MARSVLPAVTSERVRGPVRPVASDPDALRRVARRVRPVSLATDRLLPVLPALEGLFPEQSLKRGSTIAVSGRAGVSGSTSLAFALIAAASGAGSWAAAVAVDGLGLAAARAMRVSFERLAVVPEVPDRSWSSVVAALVDAFDVVMVAPGRRPAGSDGRRLRARAREAGAVLIELGVPAGLDASTGRTHLDADVRLTVTTSVWEGLGHGHGHLRARRAVVEAQGRGAASMPRRVELWLPDADGDVAVVGPSAGSVATETTTTSRHTGSWRRVG